jgi:hypothetical protein
MLSLDARLLSTDWDLPPGSGFEGRGSDLKGGFAPLGSLFKIVVETTYTLWDSGWKSDNFFYKDSQVVSTTSTAAPAAPAGPRPVAKKLIATLTAAAESPGPGDSKGSGTAQITLNPAKGEVCYDMTVRGIQASTAAHIHQGVAGREGPVRVSLDAPKTGSVKGCKIVDANVVQDIMQNPANYYVNVHNAEHPKGAVRGQLAVQP